MNKPINITGNHEKWLITKKTGRRATFRLFCFPFAGGGASVFRLWQSSFPEDVEVISVQYPGRENRISERPIADLHALVACITDVLMPRSDLPFAFFGHSLGAKIAFETSKELFKRNGLYPLCLLVSGCRAPHLSVDRKIHHLDDKEFVESLRLYNGTPEAVLKNTELMDIFLPMLRADFILDEKYTSEIGVKINCPIYAFGGDQDIIAPFSSIREWSRFTEKEFKATLFNGGHFFFKDQQTSFLQMIHEYLKKTLDASSPSVFPNSAPTMQRRQSP